MTWCRGINSSNMMKTPSFYPWWQQYNTCLAGPTITGKGHHKIEPKAKHFSHGKKDQSSRPNETDNSNKTSRPMVCLSGCVLHSACALIPSCSDPTSHGQVSVHQCHPWISNADTHSTRRIYNRVAITHLLHRLSQKRAYYNKYGLRPSNNE